MSGKRRDFDGQFALIDVNFILDDPRLDELSPANRWLYIGLWCICVRERTETLPDRYGPKAVARRTRLDIRTTREGLRRLQQECLISIDAQNRITVIGVKDKHQNLTWKDAPISPVISPHIPPKEKEKEKEKEYKEEKEKEVPSNPTETSLETPMATAPNPHIDLFVLNEAERLAREFVERWSGQPSQRKAADMICGLLRQGSDAVEIQRAFARAGPGRQIWNVLKELIEIYEYSPKDTLVRDRAIAWLMKQGDIGHKAAKSYASMCETWLQMDKIPLALVHLKVDAVDELNETRQRNF